MFCRTSAAREPAAGRPGPPGRPVCSAPLHFSAGPYSREWLCLSELQHSVLRSSASTHSGALRCCALRGTRVRAPRRPDGFAPVVCAAMRSPCYGAATLPNRLCRAHVGAIRKHRGACVCEAQALILRDDWVEHRTSFFGVSDRYCTLYKGP